MIKRKIKNILGFKWGNYITNKYILWGARIFSFLLCFLLILESNFLWLTGYMPNIKQVRNPDVAVASELYTADSVLIARYYTENRTPVSIKEVSPIMIKALICTEDVRFYSHHGFDLFSICIFFKLPLLS